MKNNARRIFGVDPGLARCGWAMIEARGPQLRLMTAGRVITAAGQPDAQRLDRLFQKVSELLRELQPERLAIEKLFFTTNVSTAMSVGQARGVALLAAAQAKIPVAEFTPTAIKQAVCGDGRADKRQVQLMLKTLLKLDRAPASDDMADAMAVAICGVNAEFRG